jgi:hypothetical protein
MPQTEIDGVKISSLSPQKERTDLCGGEPTGGKQFNADIHGLNGKWSAKFKLSQVGSARTNALAAAMSHLCLNVVITRRILSARYAAHSLQ